MTNPDSECSAAIFAGGGGPELGKAAAGYLREIRDRGPNVKTATDALNVLWSTADVGSILAKNGWRVITGGYYMGSMGMASRSAYVVSKKQDETHSPIGAIFSEFFPNDPLTIQGELVNVGSLS